MTVGVADLAGEIVRVAAPDQHELFELVRAGWTPGRPVQAGRWSGGAVGSGLVSTLTSDLIFPILVATCTQVCGAGALAVLGRRRWWRHPRRRAAADAVVTVDVAQLATFRTAMVEHAVRLGLPADQATVLGDAALGALQRAATDAGTGS